MSPDRHRGRSVRFALRRRCRSTALGLARLVSVSLLLGTPLIPTGAAQALQCWQEAIYVRAGGDIGSGTQSTQYNFNRPPCTLGNPMANTTFLKLRSDAGTYVETGYYQAKDELGRDVHTAFYEYLIYPSRTTVEHYWDEYRTETIPQNTYLMYAISKLADDRYSILLAFQVGGTYIKWDTTPWLGSSAGRPESEISRWGPGDASGNYRNLQFKDPADATWHPWRSLDCDYQRTTITDWRVHRVTSTSWYSEHLPAAGSGCE